jgi:tetratricopeptide (TPR) repeat protein
MQGYLRLGRRPWNRPGILTVTQERLNLSADQALHVEELGLAFMAEFLEIETRHHPENVEAWAELGHVYTRQGRLEDGLAVDRRLVGLVPENPTVHYNLACSKTLLGDREGALDSLEQAVRLGYDDAAFLLQDKDLISLRTEPRFQALVARLANARNENRR